jgi:hypothetical protein
MPNDNFPQINGATQLPLISVSVRVNQALKLKLEMAARKKGLHVGTYIRMILTEHCAQLNGTLNDNTPKSS